jgi:hypothetical protein
MYYFVYAMSIKDKDITAALSFQDKETAMRAYEVALQEMTKTHSTYGFHFGYTDGIEIKDDDYTDVTRVKIDYPLSSERGYQEGWYTSAFFDNDDFEAAECNTKIILTEDAMSDSRQDIQFMRYVKLIADDVPISDIENHEPTTVPPRKKETIASPVESDIADYPHMTQAASGRGVSIPAVKAFQASIEPANAPGNVNIKNPKSISDPVVKAIENQTKEIQRQTAILENMGESSGRNTAKWLLKSDLAGTRVDLQEEILSEMGFEPIEVTDLLYPNADKRRIISQRISKNKKKSKKKAP